MTRYNMTLVFLIVLSAFFFNACGKQGTEPETYGETADYYEEDLTELPTDVDDDQDDSLAVSDDIDTESLGESDIQQETQAIYPESDESFVLVTDYISNIYVDLKYASADNFTGVVIYDFDTAYLRSGTVKKLAAVAKEVEADGYSLKIWDAYRPVDAQFKLWELCPNSKYVANPNKGFSSHSRGNTVDITLIKADGGEVQMPTGFDDFSLKADRDYTDCPEEAAENALYLEAAMIRNGFKPYQGEWWHYTDTNTYGVEKDFNPK